MPQDNQQPDGQAGRPKKPSKNEYVRKLPGMVQWGERSFGYPPDIRYWTRASEGAQSPVATSDSYNQQSYPFVQEYPRPHPQSPSTPLPAVGHQTGPSGYDRRTFGDVPSEAYIHQGEPSRARETGYAGVQNTAYQPYPTSVDRRTRREYQHGDQQSIAGSYSQAPMQAMNAPSTQLVGSSAHVRSPPSHGTSATPGVSSRSHHSSSARAHCVSPYPPPSTQVSASSSTDHGFVSSRSASANPAVFYAPASSSVSMKERQAAQNLYDAAEDDHFLEGHF